MGKTSKKRPAGDAASPPKKSKLDSAFEAKANQRAMPKIVNKLKRAEIYAKWLKDKKLLKKAVKEAKRETKKSKPKSNEGGAEEFDNSEETKAKAPKTLDNTRETELTLVTPDDTEVLADEEDDEFAPYFSGVIKPKIIITTRPRPSAELFQFIQSLLTLIPNSYYWPRRDYELKDITEYARNKEFSHLMVLSEKAKVCNGVVVSHLGVPARSSGIWKGDGQSNAPDDWPEDDEEMDDEMDDDEIDEMEEGEGDEMKEGSRKDDEEEEEEAFDDHADDAVNDINDEEEEEEEEDTGPRHIPTDEHTLPGPTAFFKINNIVLPKKIKNHGAATGHIPELILNNFTTRLGHRAGRFFGSLFPHNPEFKGRQVVTFHNQRDYVFVRHHRYVFKPGTTKADKEKNRTRAKLQELGPRFSLKMRWLLSGGFDTKFGEYEWFHKRKEQDTSRRKFHM
ncbi:hypothetical protein TrLO_g2115 [Triparma laevis f. longispina]|uniref:Brix domain-containing protein n=1 Tax=Triparma laevis f. longispina TaxID=1714387 RepID=A0A9W7KW96_9STRA|nr:hypothetical protein TrLO_g2115 [Triparma laevis f. longispina]